MSNGFKWELSKWGDGTIHLAYWDIYGHDVLIALYPNGLTVRHWDTYEGDDVTEHTEVIDLGLFLREWITRQMEQS